MRKILVIALAALCLCSCEWLGLTQRKEDNSYTVLLYVAGDNSISYYAQENVYGDEKDEVSGLVDGFIPLTKDKKNNLLVYYDTGEEEGPKLIRFHKGKDGQVYEQLIKRYPPYWNSAMAESLTEVLYEVQSSFPAKRNGLILWSHGTGYLPEGYYSSPKDSAKPKIALQSFAEEDEVEMEISELRAALSPYHFDYIIFDCCLMGGVEVAYELRDCADYFAFSPTEILADGFRYDTIMDRLFNIDNPLLAVTSVCKDYMDLYFSKPENERYATVSTVKTSELEGLAAACKPIFANHREQISTLDFSEIQAYGRGSSKNWFYDLDDFIRSIASPQEYATFNSALSKAVVFKSTTPKFLSITINHFSGLSIYVPRSRNVVLNSFYKGLEWNKATGLVE